MSITDDPYYPRTRDARRRQCALDPRALPTRHPAAVRPVPDGRVAAVLQYPGPCPCARAAERELARQQRQPSQRVAS